MNALLDELAARELARTPVTAVRLGALVTDATLPDMSEAGVGAAARDDRRWIQRLEALPDGALTEEERFDRDLAVSSLKGRLILDDWQLFRRSPQLYTTPVLAGLRTAPQHADRYLAQATEVLEHGRRNLDPDLADPVPLRSAAAQAKAGAAICARIGGASADTAAQAYEAFADFLANLADRAHGDPAIGEDHYTALLHLYAGDRYDANSAYELGREDTRTLRARLSTLPAGTAQQPSARDTTELVRWYRAETERARRFCADHEIVTLPDDEACDITLAGADEVALSPVASYAPPPLLAPRGNHIGSGRLVIPVPADGSPEMIARAVAMQRRNSIATVTVHETYPGHHAHYSRMSRRPLRALFTTPFFTEGWGVYTERLAGELGYFTAPGELRGHLTALLVRAVRATVDPALHSGAINPAEAQAILTEQLHLPNHFAEAEVHRALAYPTQPASYLVGATEIADIVTTAGKPDRHIHDQLTALGAPALPLARLVIHGCG